MNNNITEDECSKEVCVLLQEKGFDVQCSNEFYDGHPVPECCETWSGSWGGIQQPTHALAIKWLRVNFGIHISVDFDSKNWFAVITILPNKDRHIYGSSNSPEQATEAALLYTLKNLI